MCGICGKLRFDGAEVERDLIVRMCRTLVHRGPDAEGVYTAPYVGLGQRRLSIIDLSDQAVAPLSNEDGSVWVTYNGEIYNFRELRAELAGAGPSLPDGRRHRGHRPPVRGVRGRVPVAPARHVRLRALGRPRPAPVRRPRPLRQEAALLRPPAGGAGVRVRDQGDHRGPGRVRGPELPGARRVPHLPVRPEPADRLRVHREAPGRPLPDVWRRRRACGSSGTGGRRSPERFDGSPEDARGGTAPPPARGGADAAGLRRAGGRLPQRRRRLVHGRGADGGGERPAGEDVLDRLRADGRYDELPYARQVAERYGTDHHEFVVEPRRRRGRCRALVHHFNEPFADSSALPDLLPGPPDAPARDGCAERRRRRRELRRVRQLPPRAGLGPGRRAAARGAGGGGRPAGVGPGPPAVSRRGRRARVARSRCSPASLPGAAPAPGDDPQGRGEADGLHPGVPRPARGRSAARAWRSRPSRGRTGWTCWTG